MYYLVVLLLWSLPLPSLETSLFVETTNHVLPEEIGNKADEIGFREAGNGPWHSYCEIWEPNKQRDNAHSLHDRHKRRQLPPEEEGLQSTQADILIYIGLLVIILIPYTLAVCRRGLCKKGESTEEEVLTRKKRKKRSGGKKHEDKIIEIDFRKKYATTTSPRASQQRKRPEPDSRRTSGEPEISKSQPTPIQPAMKPKTKAFVQNLLAASLITEKTDKESLVKMTRKETSTRVKIGTLQETLGESTRNHRNTSTSVSAAEFKASYQLYKNDMIINIDDKGDFLTQLGSGQGQGIL